MSGSSQLSPTAAYVDATGIHAPTFTDIQAFLVSQYQAIYGADIETDPSTQDGQLIGIFALAMSDVNAACVAVYNSFSPSTAQGIGLSSMVKINGLTRRVPSNSTAPMLIVGVTGTVIANGIVQALALLEEKGEAVTKPLVVRLDGNNAELGRQILTDANHPLVEQVDTMDGAADRAAELANK